MDLRNSSKEHRGSTEKEHGGMKDGFDIRWGGVGGGEDQEGYFSGGHIVTTAVCCGNDSIDPSTEEGEDGI